MAWSILILVACAVAYVQAHGRLVDPVNRASLWRDGYDAPPNYDDDGLNCGGFYQHWSVNGGKCGICGDAYDRPQPRPHELGGTYGLGYIVATYEAGQIIPFNVYISAYHLGFWEFRICPEPYYQQQECFDEGYLLELEEGGTKYYPLRGEGTYIVNFRLPENLTCDHCVLQWHYTAGNNWGICANGTQGLGCGNQEQFFSCSDIAIVPGLDDVPESPEATDPPFSTVVTDPPTSTVVTNPPTTTVVTDPPTTTVVTDPPTSTVVTDPPSTTLVTETPEETTWTVIDGLTQDFVVLNPTELKQLLRGIDPSQYRIFYGHTPVTSNSQAKKRYTNKHRKKKNKNRKNKRYNKQIIIWR